MPAMGFAGMARSYIYGYPLFCNTECDACLACVNLSGVWVYARALMKIAPDDPL